MAQVTEEQEKTARLLAECQGLKDHSTAAVQKMNTLVKIMEKHAKQGTEQVEKHEAEVVVIQKLSKKASQQFRDCAQREARMERREHFICDYVDVVRESEDLSLRQYIKTLYAATVCKEVAKSTFSALESSLTMFQSVQAMKCDRGTAVMADTSDVHSGIQEACKELLQKVRYLLHDVDDVDRITKTLDSVSFLDETLRVANDEHGSLSTESYSLSALRTVEKQVREVMPYRRDKYNSLAHYEREVVVQTEKRLKATTRHESQLLSASVHTLKKAGAPSPGELPKEPEVVVLNDDEMEKDDDEE